jgi:uncharacterized membrane protein YbhN (UPF0104 family)
VLAIASQLSFHAVVDQFHRVDWRYVWAAFAFGFATTGGRVARYCLFFPFTARVRLLYVVFAYIRGVNYILPFRMGEPVALYMLKRSGLVSSMSAAAPAWLLFRVGDVLALLILLFPALALILPDWGNATASLALLTLSAGAAIMLLSTAWQPGIEMLLGFLKRHVGRLSASLDELQLGFATIKSRSRIAWSVALSLVIASLNVIVSVCAIWSLSLPVSLPTGMAIAVTAQAMDALPFRPPLAIGLQESVWTGLLVLAGLDSEQAFAGALSVRSMQMAVIAAETVVATGLGFVLVRTATVTLPPHGPNHPPLSRRRFTE